MPIHALWLLGLILLTSPVLAQEQGKAVVSQIKVPASASIEVVTTGWIVGSTDGGGPASELSESS